MWFLISRFAVGLLFVVGLHLPYVGNLFALLAFPLFWLFPEFAALGPDVGVVYSYGTLFLTSAKAWIAFLGYFTVLAMVVSLMFLPHPVLRSR